MNYFLFSILMVHIAIKPWMDKNKGTKPNNVVIKGLTENDGQGQGSFERHMLPKAVNEEDAATSTYINAVQEHTDTCERRVFLPSKTFSPDDDSFEDELIIRYCFPNNDWVANIRIYDDQGNLIKKLLPSQGTVSSGIITWNGLNELQQLMPSGIYLLYMMAYHPDGATESHLISFVLAEKFN